MPRFQNPYAVQTPIGQALQSIATSFFAQQSPRDLAEREALAEARRAQSQSYTAKARRDEAETDALRAETSARQNFFGNVAGTIDPESPGQVENFVRGTPVLAFEGGVQPRPAALSPGMESYARRALQVSPMVAAGGGDAEKIAKAFKLMQEQGFADDTATGAMSPTRFAQLNGKEPFDVKGDQLVNVVEGIFGPQTDTGKSVVSLNTAKAQTERAQQGSYGASANAANALAGLRNAEATNEKAGTPGRSGGRGGSSKMQWVRDEESGETVLMDQTEIAGNPGRFTPVSAAILNPKDPKAPGARSINGPTSKAIDEAIPEAAAAVLNTPDTPGVSPALRSEIRALTEVFFQDPNSPGYASPFAAAKLAVEQLQDSMEHEKSFFGSGEIVRKPGAAPSALPARATQPSVRKPPAAATPQPAAPTAPSVPESALQFYRANRDKPGVRDQFIKKYGFDPDGGA